MNTSSGGNATVKHIKRSWDRLQVCLNCAARRAGRRAVIRHELRALIDTIETAGWRR